MAIPPISDMMTPMPLTIGASLPVRKAKLFMSTHSIRHLPVVEQGRLVGILSDRDIKLSQAVSKAPDFDDSVFVKDICQQHPYVVDGSTPADAVLAHMYSEKLGSALVTANQKLVGIFTVTDACRAFAEYLRSGNVTSLKPKLDK